jgi:hypothetical protein
VGASAIVHQLTADAALFAPWVGLLFADVAGVAAVVAYRRGWRGAGVLGLMLLCWGVGSQFLLVTSQTVAEWAQGEARIRVAAPGNPDPETRLEEWPFTQGCCVCDPRWDSWSNGTVRALTAVFGPGPGAWRGPYPSAAEARRRLAVDGSAPRLAERGVIEVGGQRFAIRAMDLEATAELEAACDCDLSVVESDGLGTAHIARGGVDRAVALAPDALIVQRGKRIELRVWHAGAQGRVWAAWEGR